MTSTKIGEYRGQTFEQKIWMNIFIQFMKHIYWFFHFLQSAQKARCMFLMQPDAFNLTSTAKCIQFMTSNIHRVDLVQEQNETTNYFFCILLADRTDLFIRL